MVNAQASAGIDYTVTTEYTLATLPALLNTGDRVSVAPGKVYEYIGAAPRAPPGGAATYATDPGFRLVSEVTAGGALSVSAEDSSQVLASVEVVSTAISKSTGGLDLVADYLTRALTDYQYTTSSGTRAIKQGELVLDPTTGSVYRFSGPSGTTVNLATAPANAAFKKVTVGDTIAALKEYLPNVTASPASAAAGAAARNDVRGGARASITGMTVTAAGALTVAALETATIRATGDVVAETEGGSPFAEGKTNGIAFQIATNVVLSGAEATVTNSVIRTTGAGHDVAVTAGNTSTIEATYSTEVRSQGLAIGVTLAFNSIGWAPNNILFNTLARSPAPTSSPPSSRRGRWRASPRSTIDASGGVRVQATSDAESRPRSSPRRPPSSRSRSTTPRRSRSTP